MAQAVSQTIKTYVRIAYLFLLAWACVGPVGSILAAPHRVVEGSFITVAVYNYAHVGRTELHEAENQAASLFALAGVRVEWLEYSRKLLASPSRSDNSIPDFSIRILYVPTTKQVKWIHGPDALGQSTISPKIEATISGRIANVFYERVRFIASLWNLYPGQVLGEAMAHELGHLLLGPRHSRQGIMQAEWTSQDLIVASRGGLRFSPAEMTALQHAVQSLEQAR